MTRSMWKGALMMGAALALAAAGTDTVRRFDGKPVPAERIDSDAKRMMAEARVQGLAMAVIDDGKVVFVRSWGRRNVEKNLPLQTDTIMYGASLTKFAFAYMVMQLVDERKVDLDRSIADYLPKPLPEYPFYEALKGDERWRKLTPRILLSSHAAVWPTSRSSSRTRRCGSTSIPGRATPTRARASS